MKQQELIAGQLVQLNPETVGNKMVGIVAMYVGYMKSIPDISKETGVPNSTVRYALVKAGVIRSREEAVRIASKQGKLGTANRGKKLVFTEEWKRNISKGKIAQADATANGVSLKKSGYVSITRGENKDRGQHTVIMEAHIGRRMLPGECVHHKDKNRSNNNIENLEIMSRSAHASLHAKEALQTRERDGHGKFK